MSEDIYAELDDFDPGPLVGYLRDPEKKPGETPDKEFSAELRPALSSWILPGDVDFSEHTTDTNQYSAPSCVGNATADAVEVLNSLAGHPPVQLSRMFIWTLCRNMMDTDRDGRSDIDQIKGTYIRLAFEVLHLFGVCREDIPEGKGGWPYKVDDRYMKRLPDMKAMRAAIGHKIHSYYRITETGEDRIEALLDALRSKHPVVFGTLVDKAFMRLRGPQTAGIPKGATEGGHAMMLVGYDSAKGFIVKNSWGPGWGEGGLAYMAPEYMAWDKTWDIWVPTMGTVFNS